MDVVCDTSVWYRIGQGFDPSSARRSGARLLLSPVSFLEIGSEIFEKNFEKRRRAARAVLDHGDDVLEDPERHIARLWNLSLDGVPFDWRDAFKTIADATSPEDIQKGVADFRARVRRRVNIPFLWDWRNRQWKSFENDVISALDSVCPGYARARAKCKAIHMDAATRTLFRNFLDCKPFFKVIVMSTRYRPALHFTKPVREPTPAELTAAETYFAPYAKAYGEYLFKVATDYAPRPNDWGDLEFFTYLQEGWKLLTFDSRWVAIAQEAGLANHLWDV